MAAGQGCMAEKELCDVSPCCPALPHSGGRGDEEQATSKQESIFYENNYYRLLPIMLFSPKATTCRNIAIYERAPPLGADGYSCHEIGVGT